MYLSPHEKLISREGVLCVATFFGPFDREVEPYIRISTGEYPAEKRKYGRDSALAGYLRSLSHELVHYYQWLATGNCTERGVVVKADAMVARYALDVDHP